MRFHEIDIRQAALVEERDQGRIEAPARLEEWPDLVIAVGADVKDLAIPSSGELVNHLDDGSVGRGSTRTGVLGLLGVGAVLDGFCRIEATQADGCQPGFAP